MIRAMTIGKTNQEYDDMEESSYTIEWWDYIPNPGFSAKDHVY